MTFLSFFFFSSRRRHTRLQGDWSSDVCSSDLSHENSSLNNVYCFSCDRSISYLDTPNALNLSGRYELPFGAGKKMLNHGLAASVLGNWAVAGIYSYSTGFPVAGTSPDNS